MTNFLRILALSVFLFPLFAASALGEGRLVRVIVPYAPGGNIDVTARIYARKVGELLKENWMIENQSGANGTIGAAFVSRAAPDGNTLLFAGDAHFMVRLVMKNPPYDPFTDFTAICLLYTSDAADE